MNENNDGTRSFEPIGTEQQSPNKVTQQKKKPDLKATVIIAIISVASLVILLFVAMLITELVYKYNEGIVKMTTVDVPTISSKSGELAVIDFDHPIDPEIAVISQEAVKNVFTYNSELRKINPNIALHYQYQDSNDISLRPEVITKFNTLTSALYNETACADILLRYGYLLPKPETYEHDYVHQLGYSVYIALRTDGTHKLSSNPTVYEWLNANAPKYGFYNPDPKDLRPTEENIRSTQFRYVGIPHAAYISENGISVAEYVSMIKNEHSGADKALKIGDYYVYYVDVENGETTSVSVPADIDYTISGDNMGGFIVTYQKKAD